MYISLIPKDDGSNKPASVIIDNDFSFQPPTGCQYAPAEGKEGLWGVITLPSLPSFGIEGLPAILIELNRKKKIRIERIRSEGRDIHENKQKLLASIRSTHPASVRVLHGSDRIYTIWAFFGADVRTMVDKDYLEARQVQDYTAYSCQGYVLTERYVYKLDGGSYSAFTHNPEMEEILHSVRPVGPPSGIPPADPLQALRRAEKELNNRLNNFSTEAFATVRQRQLSTNADGVRQAVQSALDAMQQELLQHKSDLQAELDRTSLFAFSQKSELRAAIQKDDSQISKLSAAIQGVKALKTNAAALLAYMIAYPDVSFTYIQHRPGLVSKDIISFDARNQFSDYACQLQEAGLCESPFQAPFLFDKRLQYTWKEIGDYEQDDEALRLLYASMGGSKNINLDQMRRDLLNTFMKDLNAVRFPAKA